ncbi:MAG: heme o synthase [Nannocystaceae bacterium]
MTSSTGSALARDLLALCKPGIVRMCVLMTLGGLWLAPDSAHVSTVLAVVLGSALAVAAASALNMVVECVPDRRMKRTADRPVAAGRISPAFAGGFAMLLWAVGMAVLLVGTNVLTTVLAAFALLSYVFIYTPLKYRTPLALVIGAVPGAVPPLLGWTAVTNEVGGGGIVLASILFLWQMPHFLAFACRRRDEYARADVRCVPVVRGSTVARIQATAWAAGLVPVSLLLTPLGVTGWFYFVCALLLGIGYFGCAAWGLFPSSRDRWPRTLFLVSLLYLPALTLALVIDINL